MIDKEFKRTHYEVVDQHKQTSRLREENTSYDESSERFGIDRYFTIEGRDLVNLFSVCYVTPRRLSSDYYSNFFKFTVPAGRRKAVHLEFEMPHEGFLDFSVKQLPSNKVTPDQKSKLALERHHS